MAFVNPYSTFDHKTKELLNDHFVYLRRNGSLDEHGRKEVLEQQTASAARLSLLGVSDHSTKCVSDIQTVMKYTTPEIKQYAVVCLMPCSTGDPRRCSPQSKQMLGCFLAPVKESLCGHSPPCCPNISWNNDEIWLPLPRSPVNCRDLSHPSHS